MLNMDSKLLALIPLLPLAGFAVNGSLSLASARTGKPVSEKLVSLIACAMPFASFILALLTFWQLSHAGHEGVLSTGSLFNWIDTPLISVDFAFQADHLTAVMLLIITGVGSLIHLYSTAYLHGDKGFARYFAYLNLFLFFMLVLVMADNLLVLFVGWEGVGLCSYLLIGFWFEDINNAVAGKKAFVVNRIGDFGFLLGIFLILYSFVSQSQSTENTYLNFAFMEEHREIFAPLVTAITLCLFAGATGKSAQIPLYVWLPDAMAGPTPVSALIHAATMVTAGIYMIARMHFLFAMSPATLQLIACIGLATAVMAALIGLTQYDIKKVLAYSTVSQLGYMFLALGVGAPIAAVFHVMTHAFFKACLFLGSGSVIHAVHDQDIRKMGGLRKKMPVTFITFLISTLAIAGLPPLAGFFSKDEILFRAFMQDRALYVVALFAAGLTAFYMFRMFTFVFLGQCRNAHPDHIHESPAAMTIPLIVLAVLAIVGGWVGVPHVLGGSNHFHHWLGFLEHGTEAPEAPKSLEMGLMGLSTVWALLMCALSVFLYSRRLDWTMGIKRRLGMLYRLVADKFRIDELYNCVVIKPVHFISKWILWKGADQRLIDGLMVHGLPDFSRLSARCLSLLQTGLLGHYLVYLWAGLVILLFMTVK